MKKVLFIGGTGIISSACSQLAISEGFDLFLLNRGKSIRQTPIGAKVLTGDIRNPGEVRRLIGKHQFDVVVDWVAYNPEHIKGDLDLFRDRTQQYIFISSASAYQKPPGALPITETTPLENPFWQYSRDKIACEKCLMDAWANEKFPVTIVRPSHTYDPTYIPIHGGWTVLDRILNGKDVIVHGDGTSLWTLTHHKDFALGFTGLLLNTEALGKAYHITSDEWLTWDGIVETLASALGRKPNIIHLPSDLINAYDPVWGASLLGDKSHCGIFDNSRIKKTVPGFQARISFAAGAVEIIDWYREDPSRQVVDRSFNELYDKIIASWRQALPEKLIT